MDATTTSIVIMGVALGISLIIIAIVSVGMRSNLPSDASELTLFMAKAGSHLNGEAEPPAGVTKIAEALPGRGARSSGKG